MFVAAFEHGEPGRAVINVNVLDDAPAFTSEPVLMDFDGEDEATRRARRARAWAPAIVATPGAGRD